MSSGTRRPSMRRRKGVVKGRSILAFAFLGLVLLVGVSRSVYAHPPFTAAAVISPSPAVIDAGQSASLITTAAWSGGTSPYTCEWLEAAPGAEGFSNLGNFFSCSISSPPRVSTGSLSIIGNWTFYLVVDDHYGQLSESNQVNVTVNPALAPPTISVSPGAIDTGQNSTLTTTASFSGGTSPYTCQWLQMAPGAGSYSSLGSPFSCNTSSLPTVSTGTLSTLGVWHFELQVGDSASAFITSAPVTVTVNPLPTAPTISVSPAAIGKGTSTALLTTAVFTGGSPPYTCQWLEKSPTENNFVALWSSFTVGCTPISKPSVTTGALATPGTWSFELRVTDAEGATATSSPVAVTVSSLPGTVVTLSCSSSSITVGSATTCKATVAGFGPVPTGYVTFSTNSLGTFSHTSCRLYGGYCQVRFTAITAGPSVALIATYGGDANNFQSAGTYNLIVTTKATRTTVSCSPMSAVAGSSTIITCRVTVRGYFPTGTVTLSQITGSTGSVSFSLPNPCTLAHVVNLLGKWSVGTCSVAMTGVTAGTVTIQATYGGDFNNTVSSGISRPTIAKSHTATAISCTETTLGAGTQVTCTATVTSGYPSPAGTVTWTRVSGAGRVTFSSEACAQSSLGTLRCSVTVAATHAGTTTIEAVYSGDSNNLRSSRTALLTIAKVPTTTKVSCTESSFGVGSSSSITCTATVSGGYSPTGTVSWSKVSGIGRVAFSAGLCTPSSGTLICTVTVRGIFAGSVMIEATYNGDANNIKSSGTLVLTIT